MRKVLFLMFLLLLMGLGAAGVKAQVRIGGNGAPNAAAVLDLNATDATTGTKGLALPRVNLTSNTAQITSGVANLTGMLVYNTSATLGVGVYFWNGTTWVRANLPATSRADSGKLLLSNGQSWVAGTANTVPVTTDTITSRNYGTVTWTKVIDTVVNYVSDPGYESIVIVPGMTGREVCLRDGGGYWIAMPYNVAFSAVVIYNMTGTGVGHPDTAGHTGNFSLKCYRPSA